jgi:AraC-like DNA-binding protein
MARICHLSESEFSRVFHHEHGVSFRRFLVNYRIAIARDFLSEPHASVSQVAYAVGFNDLSHFGRMFRRLVGEPATLPLARERHGTRPLLTNRHDAQQTSS